MLAQPIAHRIARAGLGLGRNRVLEVEDHRAGAGSERLGEALGSVARNEEVAALQPDAASSIDSLVPGFVVGESEITPDARSAAICASE